MEISILGWVRRTGPIAQGRVKATHLTAGGRVPSRLPLAVSPDQPTGRRNGLWRRTRALPVIIQVVIGFFVVGFLVAPFATGGSEDRRDSSPQTKAGFTPTGDAPATGVTPTTAAAVSQPPPAEVVRAAPCQPGQIKGNNNSNIFHTPGQSDYASTYANVTCFGTEAEAVAAGFRRAQR